MDKMLNGLKCMVCHETLKSPLLIPCNHNVCKKHVSNQTNDVIRCKICRVEHQIPTNGFILNKDLKEIIESGIANLDFGSVHKSAKKSCESVEETLKEIEGLLKDPNAFTHKKITELKDIVQLKGEELKLIIDQGEEIKLITDEEMKKLIDKLEEYEKQCREYLSSNEFIEESKRLESEMEIAQSNLDSWLENLNKLKIDEEKWKCIKKESDQKLKSITEEMDEFKNKLLLNNLHENQNEVNWFKSIKIDSLFEYVNRDFLVSRIIKELVLSQKLEELLKKKDLNDRKWSLLYRGSRDGFQASDFHSHCNGKPNTLTIVKSTKGNIFGGFTSAQWMPKNDLCQEDKSAFIFSLINKENRPLLFEHTSSGMNSICLSSSFGPVFGGYYDLFICDNSNENTFSFSNLGSTYTHPEYSYGSEKAKTILAGTYNFQVQEIEVFQLQ